MPPRFTALFFSLTAAMAPLSAHAEDACTQIIVYAVKQFCSLLPNGQSLCQPVALTGPSPACQVPDPGQFKPVPLAPPTVQFPMGMPMAAPTPYPAMPPVMPPSMPASPYNNPYLPSPMTAQPVSPFGTMPMPFMAPPAATVPAAPPAAVQAPTPAPAAQSVPLAPAPTVATTSPAPLAPVQVLPPSAVMPAPKVADSAAPAATDISAPEPVTPNLPDAPSLPAVVAEAVALFPFDSAELTLLGQQTLDSWLASAPVGMPVVVYGHADRLGPEDYNMELSQRRADAARMYLISKGKDPRDIRSVGKGEADPVKRCKGGPNDATKACLAPNRRVLITHE